MDVGEETRRTRQISMKETMPLTRRMDKECLHGLLEMCIEEVIKTTREKGMEK